jgi:hypothetical protein
MAYEKRDNSGSLFKNDKRKTDKHANMAGSIMVNGVDYWINGWTKETKNGDKYISLSVTPKEAKKETQGQSVYDDHRKTEPVSTRNVDLDDDIPF